MAYDNIAALLNATTLFFAVLTLIFTVKNREFERGEVENAVNALLFGFFMTVLITGVRLLESLNEWKPDALAAITSEAGTYVGYLTQIETLALAPLLAVCCLVAMFLAKDLLEK